MIFVINVNSKKDKFGAGGFIPWPSEAVSAPRVKECPVQMEAVMRDIHTLKGDSRLRQLGGGATVEVEILRVHVRQDFVLKDNHIDPEKWQPLIYNFRHYFGLGEELGSTFRAEVLHYAKHYAERPCHVPSPHAKVRRSIECAY